MNANLRNKMDFSDILYYIVLIAIGIFGSIGSKKSKKKAEDAARSKRRQPPARGVVPPMQEEAPKEEEWIEEPKQEPDVIATLDEIFKALREGRPLNTPPTEPTPAPVVTETPQPQVAITTPVSTVVDEGIRVTANDVSKDEINDKNIYDSEGQGTFSASDVDWQQAVITSEILTRKY